MLCDELPERVSLPVFEIPVSQFILREQIARPEVNVTLSENIVRNFFGGFILAAVTPEVGHHVATNHLRNQLTRLIGPTLDAKA